MSWFEYGTLTGRKRNLRKGVWLRVGSLPTQIYTKAKTYMREGEEIDWIKVTEMKPNGEVFLEFWCHNPSDQKHNMRPGAKLRYTVFHLLEKEDPKWICEGDLGRGFKE